MKQHEREYFVARIRSGIYKLDFGEIKLKIVTPTLEQDLEVQETYLEAYRQAEKDGFLTHEDMLESMKKRDIWSDEQEEKIKGLEKDIDRLKVELFQNRNKEETEATEKQYYKHCPLFSSVKQHLSKWIGKMKILFYFRLSVSVYYGHFPQAICFEEIQYL